MDTIKRQSFLQQKMRAELEDWLITHIEDDSALEVMCNEDGSIFKETGEGIIKVGCLKKSQVMSFLYTVAEGLEKRIYEKEPLLGGVFRWDKKGEPMWLRIQAAIHPIVTGPVFSIRKPLKGHIDLEMMYQSKTMSKKAQNILKRSIKERKNILVVGATGSGKTTFVRALLNEVATLCPQERVVIIEDTSEIVCQIENKVCLQTSTELSMDDLLKASLRMRPDRICIGEVRGKEAYSMVKSWNTGHPGGICSIHASSAQLAMNRLSQLILEAGVRIEKEFLSSLIHRIIFLESERKNGKKRWKLKQILQVNGFNGQNESYQFESLL